MKYIWLMITCLSTILLQAQDDLSIFEKQILIRGKDTLRYRILYPQQYSKEKAYPLLVFLHGSGERGRDNEAQLVHGGTLFLRNDIRKNFPAIVVFPQCPPDSSWIRYQRIPNTAQRVFMPEQKPPVPQQLVMQLIDNLSDKKMIHRQQVYIGGLSMGGMGVYDILSHHPGRFAAAFSICGEADISWFLQNAENIPLWIFHGGKDDIVSPASNRQLYKAFIARGAKHVRYTEYPNANHNSWDSAFAEPTLLPWLFSGRKRRKQ